MSLWRFWLRQLAIWWRSPFATCVLCWREGVHPRYLGLGAPVFLCRHHEEADFDLVSRTHDIAGLTDITRGRR